MKDFLPEEMIGFLSAMVFISGVSFAFGSMWATSKHREEVIQRGFAEWVVDKEGQVDFKWKESK